MLPKGIRAKWNANKIWILVADYISYDNNYYAKCVSFEKECKMVADSTTTAS